MAIILDEPQGTRTPVVKRTAIGQTFVGALVDQKARDMLKKNDRTGQMEKVPHPTDPRPNAQGQPTKFRQEMVLTLVTMPGTTAPAGLGEDVSVPEPGDVVRMILKGKPFGEFIDAKNKEAAWVGDVVTTTTDTAQAYDANGSPTGGQLTTQAEVDAVPRGRPVGIYGPLSKRRATAAEQQWVDLAEAEYRKATAVALPAVNVEDF